MGPMNSTKNKLNSKKKNGFLSQCQMHTKSMNHTFKKKKKMVIWQGITCYSLCDKKKKKLFNHVNIFHSTLDSRDHFDPTLKSYGLNWHIWNVRDQIDIRGLFGIHLFCWNWKPFIESTVDKGKS